MASPSAPWILHAFRADVTIPLGHPCMGGGIAPARVVVDPLEAIGFVLSGGDLAEPIVFVSVDWCEIRNEAFDAWREVLAAEAGTAPQRVLVTSVHQHDAPVMDPAAQRLLDEAGDETAAVCDPAFGATAIDRVLAAVRSSLAGRGQPVTHVGVGMARVEGVASNRRYVKADGSISYHRTSASADPDAHAAAEGTIDSNLRTLSFWQDDQPLLALSTYAVHPMSYYGNGEVSADYVGLARRARHRRLPDVVQIYASGCSGNVTAGKYNDGAPENRSVLASRMEAAMAAAWDATDRHELKTSAFRVEPLQFEPRSTAGHTPAELAERIAHSAVPYDRCLAAMGLSWRQWRDAGGVIDLPVIELGPAILTLIPGEAYVEYQLLAQRLRPDRFVMAIGYGQSATGYIPTEAQLREGDENLGDWYWVSPTAEAVLTEGLQRALAPGS
jgi:hypothetical protein